MSILATSVQQKNIQSNLGRLQIEIDRLSNQAATGKKADRFSGLGIDSRPVSRASLYGHDL